ncbi:MAG: DMT family transporter [Acidobacteriota bacterium]
MPRWLVYCMISMLIWAAWSLLSPIAARDLSGSMVQVLSSAGLIPCVLLLLFSKNLKKATHFGRGLVLATATGLMGGAGNIMVYKAIQSNGPVSLVFPISCMAPLIPILAAPVLFKEKILRIQAFGIGLSLGAIFLLNTAPAPLGTATPIAFFSEWMVYTLLSLVLFGITFITQKGATYFISSELSTIAFAAGFFLLDVIVILTDPSLTWKIPARSGWVSVLIGALMGAGSLTLFAAYRYGKASIVTPLSQLFPAITVVVAVPLFHESIDMPRGIGIVAALVAGAILSIEKANSEPSASAAGFTRNMTIEPEVPNTMKPG